MLLSDGHEVVGPLPLLVPKWSPLPDTVLQTLVFGWEEKSRMKRNKQRAKILIQARVLVMGTM